MIQKQGIQLTQDGVLEVQNLCAEISRKNHKNEISVTMAEGIARFVEQNGSLSLKQAEWLIRNADYWNLPRPDELSAVTVSNKQQKIPAKQTELSPDLADDESNSFNQEVAATLKTLLRLFESRI